MWEYRLFVGVSFIVYLYMVESQTLNHDTLNRKPSITIPPITILLHKQY